MHWDHVAQQVVNALSVGSVYALVAIGLGMVFSIVRLVNFAFGELMTIAAYTLYGVGGHVPWPVAFAIAILAAGAAAMLMERIAFRPVRGAEPVTLLLMSFALSAILQTIFLVFFGGTAKSLAYPAWLERSFTLGNVHIQTLDVTTFVVTLILLLALNQFLRRTTTGIALRAAAEDFPVTRLMGIKADRVILSAFLISGLLAGIAAILWFGNSGTVLPTSGFDPLIKGFVAAVVGGLGSLSGAALAGFLLGGLEVLFQNVLPSSLVDLSEALVFLLIIGLLLVRPGGLLSTTERVA